LDKKGHPYCYLGAKCGTNKINCKKILYLCKKPFGLGRNIDEGVIHPFLFIFKENGGIWGGNDEGFWLGEELRKSRGRICGEGRTIPNGREGRGDIWRMCTRGDKTIELREDCE